MEAGSTAIAQRQLVQRGGVLAALLIAELLALSVWLDTAALRGSAFITALVADEGAVIVRCAVAFAVCALTLSQANIAAHLQQMSAPLSVHRVERPLIAAHLALMLLFGRLSVVIFHGTPPGVPETALLLSWIVIGVTACGTAAVALLPLTFWSQLLRRTRPFLLFAGIVAISSYGVGVLAQSVWRYLSWATMGSAAVLLRPLIPNLTLDFSTFTIGSPAFQVRITASCSGYEGIGLIVVFTAAWLWINRSIWRFPQALALLPAGVLAIWIFNCVRIATLVLIGHAGAPAIALGGFHSQAGWIAFNAVALGICLTARRMSWLLREPIERATDDVRNPVTPFLLPFLAVLGAAMATQLATADFDWLYPVRVVVAAVVLWRFVPVYRQLEWRPTLAGVGIGVFAFGVWMVLERLIINDAALPMPGALGQASEFQRLAWLALRIIGGVITVPLAEELAFRGFLLRWFVSDDFESVHARSMTWLAVLLSSVAFGLLHGDRWLAGAIAGALYAMAYARRGSIGDAVVAHATTNGLIAVFVLLGGSWRLW